PGIQCNTGTPRQLFAIFVLYGQHMRSGFHHRHKLLAFFTRCRGFGRPIAESRDWLRVCDVQRYAMRGLGQVKKTDRGKGCSILSTLWHMIFCKEMQWSRFRTKQE